MVIGMVGGEVVGVVVGEEVVGGGGIHRRLRVNFFLQISRSCAMRCSRLRRGDVVGGDGVGMRGGRGVVGDDVGVFGGDGVGMRGGWWKVVLLLELVVDVVVGGDSIRRRLRVNLFLQMSRSYAMRCSRLRRGDIVDDDGVGMRGGRWVDGVVVGDVGSDGVGIRGGRWRVVLLLLVLVVGVVVVEGVGEGGLVDVGGGDGSSGFGDQRGDGSSGVVGVGVDVVAMESSASPA